MAKGIAITVLVVMLLALQWRLWVGEGSLTHIHGLKQQIELQQNDNEVLIARNRHLEAKIIDLKQGTETIEEKARHDLGMVKQGETFILVVED